MADYTRILYIVCIVTLVYVHITNNSAAYTWILMLYGLVMVDHDSFPPFNAVFHTTVLESDTR